ncbi:MAG TPA: hypothetical protein VLC30_07345 [Pseudomonas sp.]|nr:hypothetical protein [Pseudomonas sp.]
MEKLILLVAASLASPCLFAAACQVSQRDTSAQVPSVVLESCYEFTGMPAEAIDWSCSNESSQPLDSDKQKVATCKSDFKATCSAGLTQESLANHRSTSEKADTAPLTLPAGAKVITYYYVLENPQQAKVDCENAGGRWKDL